MRFSHLVLALFLAVAVAVSAGHSADRPNVVLFLVDDMGWMDSSVYGSKYYETPNMERLAKQSMRFTDAYAVPLCSPTRATILTGQYSARHRITSASGHQPAAPPDASPYPAKGKPQQRFLYAASKNYLDPGLVTLAEVLRDAGYRTGHFGKWHLGLMPEHWPETQGFETTWHCAPDPGPPSYFSPYDVAAEGRPTGQHHVGNITDGPDGEYITDRLTDEALKFIDAHRDEPFFLNLWQYGVHGPWGHKEAYTAEFAKKTDPRGFQRNPIMASMLKSVDESLGRVLDKLDSLGLTENTLFIFFSDNGGNTHSNTPDDTKLANIKPGHPKYEFLNDWRKWAGPEPPTNNAPLREGKGRIYEGGQRVPLMVRWPGKIAPDTANDTVVGAIDLYPTVLDALGLEKPAGQIVDGLSILPLLRQTGGLDRKAYFTWFPHLIPAVSVRAGDWKLIRRFEPHPSYPEIRELYNLKDDLGETHNLAAKMPDKVVELDALIDGFIADTGALAPKPNPVFSETTAAATRAPEFGLVARMCAMTVVDGALRVEVDGRAPFLGTAQVRHSGPIVLKLRLKAPAGGAAKVQWKTAGQDDFPQQGQVAEYTLLSQPGWQEISVELPVAGDPTQLVRLYFPPGKSILEIESIRYFAKGADQPFREWNFGATKP
ncbi:MAG: sulfatase [Verrucomicrobiae bacterium]|nr:sulfatase [Verrucomicrobiae bacterium]MCP5539264.1 sulfatase [Akkermansiaceae bacterium]